MQDMATPMDELKSVSSTVTEILKTGGKEGTPAQAAAGRPTLSVLRTAATSRADKRNFQRSYQQQQKKYAAKTNAIQVTQRAAGGVVDTAWQLQRELKAESNTPGYKTKPIQNALEAAQVSTQQLLQEAKTSWKLNRAKQQEQKRWLQGGSTSSSAADRVQEEVQSATTELKSAAAVDYLDADVYTPAAAAADYLDPNVSFFASSAAAAPVDVTNRQATPTVDTNQQAYEHQYQQHVQQQQDAQQEQLRYQQQQQQQVEAQRRNEAQQRAEWQRKERQQQYELRLQQQQQQYEWALQEHQQAVEQQLQDRIEFTSRSLPQLAEECIRLKDQLQNCIVNPEQTWLRSDIIEGVQNFDQALIRSVVTEMISTRNALKDLMKSKDFDNLEDGEKIQRLLHVLVSVKGVVDELGGDAQRAVSLGAAQALVQELVENSGKSPEDNENLIPVLLRLTDLQNQFETLWTEPEMEELPPMMEMEDLPMEELFEDCEETAAVYATSTIVDGGYAYLADNLESGGDDSVVTGATKKKPKIVDVVPEAFVYAVATAPVTPGTAHAEVVSRMSSEYVTGNVEVVNDYDFEAARVVTMEADDDENAAEQQKEQNLAFQLLLRSLDIFFFLLEKAFTVSYLFVSTLAFFYSLVLFLWLTVFSLCHFDFNLQVAIPTVIESSTTAKGRFQNVKQGGLGSKGWEPIGNAQKGAKRY